MKQNPYYSFSSLIHSFIHVSYQDDPKPYSFLVFGTGGRTCLGMNLAKTMMLIFLHRLVTTYRSGLHFSVYFPLDLDVGDKKWAFGEVNCELNCGEFLTRWEVIDKDSSLEEGALFPRLRSGCPIWVERVQLPNINRIEQLGH